MPTDTLQSTADHLHLMIAKEKNSGDFLLASVVQDCLIYNLHHVSADEHFEEMVHECARISMEVIFETMYLNEFTIAESVRGIMHGIVALGMDPLVGSIAVTTGTLTGLHQWIRVDKSGWNE